jgi:hypothetical protein
MRMIRALAALAAVLATVTIGLTSVTAADATGKPIRPHQHYLGLVNGNNTDVIYVACAGPIYPGRIGPPVGNQTLSVIRAPSGGGNTGSLGRQIWAQFNDLFKVVGFTTYNTPQPIPSDWQVPCGGTGTVTFTTCFGTLPCAADAEDDVVPVTFVNIAV